MANATKKKLNVTPKAPELEVTESAEEKKVNDEVTEDVTVNDTAETVETSDVKENTTDEVTINEDDTVAVPKDRMVKVRLRENHRCNIGGVQYDFAKGKVETVPEFVKKILLREDLLQSL